LTAAGNVSKGENYEKGSKGAGRFAFLVDLFQPLIEGHWGTAVQVSFPPNATVRGRVWYKLWDAPVLTLDVTV